MHNSLEKPLKRLYSALGGVDVGHPGVQKCVYTRYKGAFKGRALVQFVGNMPISFINEHGLNVCKIKYNRQTITLFLNPSEEFGNIYILVVIHTYAL